MNLDDKLLLIVFATFILAYLASLIIRLIARRPVKSNKTYYTPADEEREKYHWNDIQRKKKEGDKANELLDFGNEMAGLDQYENEIIDAEEYFEEVDQGVEPEVKAEDIPQEPPRITGREKTGFSRRGTDAGRIVMISVREYWSDGKIEDRIYAQKCSYGPWFDAETGKHETTLEKVLDRWELEESTELLREQYPTIEDIFKGMVKDIAIRKGIPYGGTTAPKSLPDESGQTGGK